MSCFALRLIQYHRVDSEMERGFRPIVLRTYLFTDGDVADALGTRLFDGGFYRRARACLLEAFTYPAYFLNGILLVTIHSTRLIDSIKGVLRLTVD